MLTPIDKRPQIKWQSRLAFSNFAEYLTVLGYGAIQGDEFVEKANVNFGSVLSQLRLFLIPGAGNCWYIGFLQLTHGLEVWLALRDAIKINFEPELGTDDNDWSAYVTELFAPVSTNKVTLIVNWRKWLAPFKSRSC